MQFVVNPLFLEWQRFNTTELSAKMLTNITCNKAKWDQIIAEAEAAAAAAATEHAQQEEEVMSEEVATVVPSRILDDSDLSSEEENRPPRPQVESVEIHAVPRDISMEDPMSPLGFITQTQPRRHSLPQQSIARDISSIYSSHHGNTSSFPSNNTKPTIPNLKRRHSLPTKTLNGASIDKLSDKLSQVAEAGSLHGSSSSLSSTLENILAGGPLKISDIESESILYTKLNHRRKSEPDRLMRRRASELDYLLNQIQRASKLGRPVWKDNNIALSDLEQAEIVRNLFNRRGSNGSQRVHGANPTSLGRQVLRSLNGNSRVTSKQLGSGNEAFLLDENTPSVMPPSTGRTSLPVTGARVPDYGGPDYERPRSLSLDTRLADLHPQLLERLQEHVMQGECFIASYQSEMSVTF